MKLIRILFLTGLLGLFLTGCPIAIRDSNLVSASYKAADKLIKGAKNIHELGKPEEYGIYTRRPILVTSLVNIDNLQESSTLGRTIGEQIGSRIAQHGYKVIEMKMRIGNIFVQERKGELVLSRRLREISVQHDAYAVVVGTYAASKESVYVTAKLIRAEDSVILSSYDYRLAVGPDTKRMLHKGH